MKRQTTDVRGEHRFKKKTSFFSKTFPLILRSASGYAYRRAVDQRTSSCFAPASDVHSYAVQAVRPVSRFLSDHAGFLLSKGMQSCSASPEWRFDTKCGSMITGL